MLSAIKDIADARPDEREEHMATYMYLKACNLLFEEGILSEKPISSLSSPVLKNIEDGFTYFSEWRKKVSSFKGGVHACTSSFY